MKIAISSLSLIIPLSFSDTTFCQDNKNKGVFLEEQDAFTK